MAMDRVTKRIGLLDHLGGGNLGDDATLAAVRQNIKSRWPEAEIIGLSMNPLDTEKRHAIPSFPIRRKSWSSSFIRGDRNLCATSPKPAQGRILLKAQLKSALRKLPFLLGVLRLLNLIILRLPKEIVSEVWFLYESLRISKSLDLLVISGGGQLLDCWGGPLEFPYTIWKWVFLARLARVKRVFLNVGAGPIDHRLSMFFVRAGALSRGLCFLPGSEVADPGTADWI